MVASELELVLEESEDELELEELEDVLESDDPEEEPESEEKLEPEVVPEFEEVEAVTVEALFAASAMDTVLLGSTKVISMVKVV